MTALQFANGFAFLICLFFWLGLAAVCAWLVDKIWGIECVMDAIKRFFERLGLD